MSDRFILAVVGEVKVCCIQQFITLAYTSLSLRFSDGIAKIVVCNFIFKYLLVHSCGPSALSSFTNPGIKCLHK